MEGVIVKAVGGFYFVRAGDRILKCAIRGKVRRQRGQAMVGDLVHIRLLGEDEGVVEQVMPRRNRLVRPPVANVDQALLVFSVTQPDPSAALLDRFLVQVLAAGIEPAICFNKFDLAESGEPEFLSHYTETGYPLLRVSARTGFGLDKLRELLADRINVLAGPSGVGKSSLLNALQPDLQLQTGDISRKLRRGRHTTRHVELITLDGGGLVADTPGFSVVDLPPIAREELAGCYPEFAKYSFGCRFNGCLHYKEPGCRVKQAVQEGRIPAIRYQNYTNLLEEVMASERRH